MSSTASRSVSSTTIRLGAMSWRRHSASSSNGLNASVSSERGDRFTDRYWWPARPAAPAITVSRLAMSSSTVRFVDSAATNIAATLSKPATGRGRTRPS